MASQLVRAHGEEDDDRSKSNLDCRKMRPAFCVQDCTQLSAASHSSALHLSRHLLLGRLIFRLSRFQHANAFVDEWQTDRQGKTSALAALDGELATVLAHNAAYNQ